MNKRVYLLITLIMLNFTIPCHSQPFPETYFEASYGRLEYGFYIPENYDSAKTYPLLTYLHGWSNNYSVYLDWYDSEFQAQHPCFVYTPKTPTTWADWSGWWDQLTEPMIAALHVMDSLISVYPVDTNRLYVYGISMGGEGTFDLLHKFPDKFAAAMSVCGGGQTFWAENIVKTPFWMFHGSADNINPPEITERVYNEMVKLGAKRMRYKSYPGYGHEIWNVAASEPSWHDWMFAHSRNDTACGKPSNAIVLKGEIVAANKIKLSWNDIRNPDKRDDKVWYYKIYNTSGLIGTTEFDKTTFTFQTTSEADTFAVSAVNYHFKESDCSNGVAYENGSIQVGVNDNHRSHPCRHRLYDNYPNPFNPSTTIRYSLANAEHVSLKLYDIQGREVKTLVNESKPAGDYELMLHVDDLCSSVYFYHLVAGEYSVTKKMVLVH
ncbi:T9SS type A sorting domain-containing protein [candidate division KSB1 bacterium]|nr:T9SS type A sorting domain-containing protein [candidate division KSB1 bacterium]